MANSWFRLYSEFAIDPKVQILPEQMQRRLIMIFCLRSSETLGTLHETEIAFHLRVTETELAETKLIFIEKGFIDEHWNVLNWNRRQYVSDSSTERVRRFRSSRKQVETLHETDVTENETTPDTDTDTDSEQIKKKSKSADKISPDQVSRAVLCELSLSGEKLQRNLYEVAKAEMQKGRSADELLANMVKAWQDYESAKLRGELDCPRGAEKFFGEGIWKDPRLWQRKSTAVSAMPQPGYVPQEESLDTQNYFAERALKKKAAGEKLSELELSCLSREEREL